MTTLTYPVHVSANGEVSPIPGWTGGETEAKVYVEQPETVKQRTPEERQAAIGEFMEAWRGCLKGIPHMTAKEIRAERLERKYGEK